MPPRRTAALLVGVGVPLLANPLWLFPHEGDVRYTYERTEIDVENGTLEYVGKDATGFRERNGLTPIACRFHDDERPRACAFDYHLVDHGPVVAGNQLPAVEPDFARLRGSYYRRIVEHSGSDENRSLVHDVEPVAPRTILAESAVNLTGASTSTTEDLPLEFRVAITGEPRTTVEELDEEDLGRIFRRGGVYYTVVATDETFVDHGLTFLRYEVPRYALVLLGLLVLVGGLSRGREDE